MAVVAESTAESRGKLDVGYLPLLDSVRALAVVLVLVYHGRLLATSAGGAVGVSVFFVLSGFLITELLLREREARGRITLSRFYGRRGRRLLPALAVMLLASAAIFAVLGRLDDAVVTSIIAASPISNWFLAAGQDLGPLTHVWTLAIEWQFYLAWPLIMVVLLPSLGRRRLGLLLVGVALGITVFRTVALLNGWPIERAKYGSDMQADALLVGGAVALLSDRLRAPKGTLAAGAATVVLAALLPLGAWSWPMAIAGGASLVVAARRHDAGNLTHWLSARPIAHLGRISYGVYLWQFPVIWHVELTMRAEGPIASIIAIGASIVLAELSYWLIERPRRRRMAGGLPSAV